METELLLPAARHLRKRRRFRSIGPSRQTNAGTAEAPQLPWLVGEPFPGESVSVEETVRDVTALTDVAVEPAVVGPSMEAAADAESLDSSAEPEAKDSPTKGRSAADRAYRRKRRVAFALVTLVILTVPSLLAALILAG